MKRTFTSSLPLIVILDWTFHCHTCSVLQFLNSSVFSHCFLFNTSCDFLTDDYGHEIYTLKCWAWVNIQRGSRSAVLPKEFVWHFDSLNAKCLFTHQRSSASSCAGPGCDPLPASALRWCSGCGRRRWSLPAGWAGAWRAGWSWVYGWRCSVLGCRPQHQTPACPVEAKGGREEEHEEEEEWAPWIICNINWDIIAHLK